MTTRMLSALERSQDRYGAGEAEAKLDLLRRLERARLPSARAVRRLHEALCFLRAYPDDACVLARVEHLKRGAGKNFLIVDAAMNDLIRPAMYDSFHEIIPVHREPAH